MTDLEAEALVLCNDLDLRKRGERGEAVLKFLAPERFSKTVPI